MTALREAMPVSPRIYMSFDLEHDQDLHDRLLAQARAGSSFSISHQSERGAMTPEWDERARARIGAADQVIVICGEHTDESVRVSAELRMAQEQDKPYLLLWGRREGMCKKPIGSRSDDPMYGWTPEILRDQIQALLRKSRPREIPASLKRQSPH